ALNGETPLGRLLGKKPDVGHLRPFGAQVYIFVPEEEHPIRSKLLRHAIEGFLVGYGEASNQYRFWILSKHRVIISWDFKLRLDTLPSMPIVETIDDVTNYA